MSDSTGKDDPRIVSRRSVSYSHQVPRCERYLWTTPPDPDTGEGGAGHACGTRATHRIRLERYLRGRMQRQVCVCRAHLGEELDDAHRHREFDRWFHRQHLPAPVVTELVLTLDHRAYAHGTRRFWLTEYAVDDTTPVELELFGTSPQLRTPHRRTPPTAHRTPDPATPAELFDDHGNPTPDSDQRSR